MVEELIEEMFRSAETGREITNEPWSSMQSQPSQQDHSQKCREKCVQKDFDRADIVRDVR